MPYNIQFLGEMVDRLIKAFQPERIYLFGSKDREVADRDSDYKRMIIVSDHASAEKRRSRLASKGF